jgi:putative ABC transport system ATP-binding protein
MAVVRAFDLVKVYRLGKLEIRALNGVTMEVAQGEFVAVMGRSGSGKSTLLNIIGALDRPTSGKVFIDDLEISSLPDRALAQVRRRKVGFVFQQFNLLPHLTALENVMLPLRYAGVGYRERRRRAEEALEGVGLRDRLRHRPSELSGGEQQRVAIARALATRPALVLADEPTGELDSHTALEVIGIIKRLNQEQGQTVIVVTHDPMVAQQAHRILYLMDGYIQREETKA